MTIYYHYILTIIFSYLIGSIPFGYILSKIGGHGDIRTIGSGNIGATNVLRTGRKDLALATLALDAAKGFLTVYLVDFITDSLLLTALSALFTIIGHCFPLWLKFKGGKGVATGIGAILALYWPVGIICIIIWLTIIKLTHISSLGGILTFILMPLLMWFFKNYSPITPFAFVIYSISLLIVGRHWQNILRLIKKEEYSFTTKKKDHV